MLDAGSQTPKHAAGVMLRDPDGRILFLKRSDKEENYAGHWGLPGGGGEDGEEPDATAIREASEEIGRSPGADMKLIDRTETPTGMQFLTYLCEVPEAFDPVLNDEHDDYKWAAPDDAPQPLHPGVSATIRKRVMANDHFAFDKASIRRTDEDGHLHVSMTPISKANICEYYGREIPEFKSLGLDPDKLYKLLRDPEELKKSAPTFAGKPLLLDHKPVAADDHPEKMTVGSVGNDVTWKAPYLMAPLTIWKDDAINGINSGNQRELSSAYRYDADMTPGEYEGEKYDGRMTNIRGNHVALVRDGRAGSDVVVGDSVPGKRSIEGKFAMPKRDMADVFAMDDANGKFSEADIAAASPKKKHREDMPESAFLEPKTRKYPVKEKRDGDWKYDRDLLLAAARRARMQKNDTLAARADAIRNREFGTAQDTKEARMARKPMMTRKAVLLQGALMANLAPKLAQDAKLNLTPILKGVTHKNFASKRDGIVSAIKMATDGKLAKDADIEDLADLLDTFSNVEPAEDDMDPNSGTMNAGKPRGMDEDKMEELRDKLPGAMDMEDSDWDELKQMLLKWIGEESKEPEHDAAAMDEDGDDDDDEGDKAMDEDEDEKAKKDMVNKTAMDSAIKAAVAKERANQREMEAAKEAVRPYVGKMSMAFDSAADVYKSALTSMKVDIAGVHPSAYGAILKAQPVRGKNDPVPSLAMDSKEAASFAERFPGVARIRQV